MSALEKSGEPSRRPAWARSRQSCDACEDVRFAFETGHRRAAHEGPRRVELGCSRLPGTFPARPAKRRLPQLLSLEEPLVGTAHPPTSRAESGPTPHTTLASRSAKGDDPVGMTRRSAKPASASSARNSTSVRSRALPNIARPLPLRCGRHLRERRVLMPNSGRSRAAEPRSRPGCGRRMPSRLALRVLPSATPTTA